MSEEFDETPIDTSSDMDSGSEMPVESSMDAGDEPIVDIGMNNSDNIGLDNTDPSSDLGMDPSNDFDDGSLGMADADIEIPDESINDLPDEETSDNSVQQNDESPDLKNEGYELPEDSKMVNASDIDMSDAMGMDDPNFWNHHRNTKADYMDLASKLPDVQARLNNGESLDNLYNDPDLGATANQYYNPEKMIRVEERPDGSYGFVSDGRHRITAAKELGHDIPVKVTR